MKSNSSWRIRLAQILLCAAIVIALVVVRGTRAGDEPVHLVTDWSHHHVIFSAPHSLGQHVHLLSNPRYVQQMARRNGKSGGGVDDFRWRRAPETPQTLNGDWSEDMGPGATVGVGNYPAKYSFNVSPVNSANCATAAQPDFVVYNTSLAGVQTAVAASQTVTFGGTGASGTPAGTVIITNGVNTLTLTATGGASGGTNFHVIADSSGANRTTNATSLVTAINLAGNGSSVGVSAGSAAGVVTITDTTAGSAGNSITLTGTINGNQGVTFGGGTFTGGVDAQANILAFDNLYSGCTGTVPSSYWAYNTGGTVVTSPALSSDGTQVAFIQTVGASATFVLLKWAASGTAAYDNPVTLTSQTTAAKYRSCTAPCMYTIAFGNGAADTTSSPFYDFTAGSDTLWVGDATGHLHKFTGVFNGDPAEVTTGGFPFLMATAPLSSPVYDAATGLVIASASFSTTNNGGRIHTLCVTAVFPSCGTVGSTTVATGILGPATSGATCQSTGPTSGDGANLFFDAPVIDSTNKVIYVGIGNDGTGSSALYQFAEGYAANNCGTEIKLGTGSTTGIPVYAGNFDNLYYCNGIAACTTGGAGHYYVCANTGGDPTLYQVTVSAAGVASGTANASAALTTAATTCGPTVEFYNPNAGPATDWIFTSVQASGKTTSPISCPANSGCIMSFNVTSGAALTTSTATVGHTTVAGGASGVVVDNTVESSPTGASQVYFTPLANQTCTTSGGTGGCAIQASQSNLN